MCMPTKKGGAGGRRMPLLDARMNTTEEKKAFQGIEGVSRGNKRHAPTGNSTPIGTDTDGLFSFGYGFCDRGVCDCSLHLHQHPPASSLSDGSLPLRRDPISDGSCSIYRRLAYWCPTALALAILVALDCF